MGNKSVVKKKEPRKRARKIVEQAVLDEPTYELAEKLEEICCMCRKAHCKQPLADEEQVLLNTCETWCPGLCAVSTLMREQLWRIEWTDIERAYGRDWL